MSVESLRRAVELVGGQSALATEIRARMTGSRVIQGHVWKWLNHAVRDVPPADYVIAISAACDWQVTPHDLRPDIYPHPTDGLPDHLRCDCHWPDAVEVAGNREPTDVPGDAGQAAA